MTDTIQLWANGRTSDLVFGEAIRDMKNDGLKLVKAARKELALCAALAPQWVAVNENGGPCDPMLEEEFLYVELPDGRVVQAMYTECNYQPEHTEIGQDYAWGHYTEVDHMEPLPVQPVRYFTPPTTTKGAGHV